MALCVEIIWMWHSRLCVRLCVLKSLECHTDGFECWNHWDVTLTACVVKSLWRDTDGFVCWNHWNVTLMALCAEITGMWHWWLCVLKSLGYDTDGLRGEIIGTWHWWLCVLKSLGCDTDGFVCWNHWDVTLTASCVEITGTWHWRVQLLKYKFQVPVLLLFPNRTRSWSGLFRRRGQLYGGHNVR